MDLFSELSNNPKLCIEDLKEAKEHVYKGEVLIGGGIVAPKDLDSAIEFIKGLSSSSTRSVMRGGPLQDSRAFQARAIILAKYRPGIHLCYSDKEKEIDQLPNDGRDLGKISPNGKKWQDILKDALEAKLPWKKDTKLKHLLRQIARVEWMGMGDMGTAWPLHNDDGVLWVTNRHVVTPEGYGWHAQDKVGHWKPLDDEPGRLNRHALHEIEKGKPPGKSSFNVVAVAPQHSHDIALLRDGDTIGRKPAKQETPAPTGLEMVWQPIEFLHKDDNTRKADALIRVLKDRLVLAIGHPMYSEHHSREEIRSVFIPQMLGLKHIMPGRLLSQPLEVPRGSKNLVLRHDCSALRGASGSCIIDLGPSDTNFKDEKSLPPTFGKVIATHFMGKPFLTNLAVPSWCMTEVF